MSNPDPLRLIIDDLGRGARTVPPERFHELVAATARRLGGEETAVYLQDYAQRVLVPIGGGDVLPIDGTVAGRAFITAGTVVSDGADGMRLWLPMLDGADRVGVIGVRVADDERRQDWERWSTIVTHHLMARAQYTDRFHQVRRREAMSLASEMVWQLLPPLVFTTQELAVAGIVEPAYEVGGDVFDYAEDAGSLHLAVFDAMGHGVQSSLTAAVTMSAYHHARRAGRDLVGAYAEVDAVVAEHRPMGFSTGVLAQLDVDTRTLRWLNAGHPRPKLLRDGRVHDLPGGEPCLPLGLRDTAPGGDDVQPDEVTLQPGDQILLYTDGAVDAVGKDGQPFGEDRLVDFLLRQSAAGLDLAETLRRLMHDVLDHAGGSLRDDATVLLVSHRYQQVAGGVHAVGGDGEAP